VAEEPNTRRRCAKDEEEGQSGLGAVVVMGYWSVEEKGRVLVGLCATAPVGSVGSSDLIQPRNLIQNASGRDNELSYSFRCLFRLRFMGMNILYSRNLQIY
jgi:hypothetical protein